MKQKMLKIALSLFLNCTICLAVNGSDSTILYLNTKQSLKFDIAEIHPWGFRDSLNRPVNFNSIDSIKTKDPLLYLELKSTFSTIIFGSSNGYYLLDFTHFNPKEHQIKEYNRYLEQVNSGEKPFLSGGKIFGQLTIGTLSGIVAAIPFAKQAVSETGPLPGMIAYTIGSVIGVYLFSNDDETTGSFSYTLLGGIIGAAFWVIPAPIGATIGYNLSREFTTPTSLSYLNSDYDLNNIEFNLRGVQAVRPPDMYDRVFSLKIIQIHF